VGDNLNTARQKLHQASANLDYVLERFGDTLAKKEGYESIDGIEAIWLYLIRTYHWTPAYVKSMKGEDIRLVLSVEMRGFTVKD
jgi:hypothetical protein